MPFFRRDARRRDARGERSSVGGRACDCGPSHGSSASPPSPRRARWRARATSRCRSTSFSAGCPTGQRACAGKCVPEAAGADCTVAGGDGGSAAIPVTSIASNAGASHTCAVLEGGTVRCWGNHDSGQLGDAEPCSTNAPCTRQATPVAVKLDDTVDMVAMARRIVRAHHRRRGVVLGTATSRDSSASGRSMPCRTRRRRRCRGSKE